MAINAYTGLPGHGKSYTVVERVILPALEKGKRVFTNIPMTESLIDASGYSGQLTQFDSQEVIDNPAWFQEVFEKGAVLCMDEVWRFWPSGMKSNQINEGHLSFFAEHRHMVGDDGFSTEVILLTQDLSQIAAAIRNLVEFTFVTVNLKAVGLDKRYRVDMYFKSVSGPKPPKSSLIKSMQGSYKPGVYAFYKSQTMSNSDDHGDESTTDDSYNIWKSKTVMIGLPLFFLLMTSFVFYGANQVLDAYSPKQPQKVHINQDEFEPGKPTHRVKPEKKADPLLKTITDEAELFITYNNGNWPSTDYRIAITTDRAESVVSLAQLKGLGFSVTTIGQCLLLLRNADYITKVQCKPAIERQETENPMDAINLL